MTALMLIIFLLLLLIGIPIFIALLIASFAGILYLGDLSLLRVIPQQFSGEIGRAHV